MWWCLVLASLLAAGTQAFAPAPIRWAGFHARRFVLAPRSSPDKALHRNAVAGTPMQLMIWSPRDGESPINVPSFTWKPDLTIAWDEAGLCIEASGDKSGDEIRLNTCTGGPSQSWNLVPWDGGRGNQIQLKGTGKCLEVQNSEAHAMSIPMIKRGASVELQVCGNKKTELWTFERLAPPSSWRHVRTLVLAMAGLGAFTLSAWLWRLQKKESCGAKSRPPAMSFRSASGHVNRWQRSVQSRIDRGGISMSAVGDAGPTPSSQPGDQHAQQRHAALETDVHETDSVQSEQSSAHDSAASSRRKFHFGDIFKAGHYTPVHSDLFDQSAAQNWNKWLAPGFLEISTALSEGTSSDVHSLLHEEAPGVYSFDLFTPEFCDKLVAEIEHADATNRENLERPNGMNRYGIVLNQLGLEPIITELQQQHVLKLQSVLFPDEGHSADDHHCFVVRYRSDEDVGLDMHEDDSDVTVNVCLGKDFNGATLSFCGLPTEDKYRSLSHTYAHAKGRAVIHRGRHRHGADDIKDGERLNLILWSYSDSYRKSDAYMQHRRRTRSALHPDPICLSYTHDSDYLTFHDAPSEADALKRGVMLDHVYRRQQQAEMVVQDLAFPSEKINETPSVCLFLEGLPVEFQKTILLDFMHLATEVRTKCVNQSISPPLFFVATESKGAVSQIRQFCGLFGAHRSTSPALAVLDITNSQYFTCGERLSAVTMTGFIEDFLQNRLVGTPIQP